MNTDNLEDWKASKIPVLASYVFFVLLFLVVGAYYLNFMKSPLSSDPADWGALGDYFGGIINPFLGLINLLILAYLTTYVSKSDGKRHQVEIEAQKRVALYSLKQDVLKEINSVMDEVSLGMLKTDSGTALKIAIAKYQLDSILVSNIYLFPFFKTYEFEVIYKCILDLAHLGNQHHRARRNLKNKEEKERISNLITDKLQEYGRLKTEFVIQIQLNIDF